MLSAGCIMYSSTRTGCIMYSSTRTGVLNRFVFRAPKTQNPKRKTVRELPFYPIFSRSSATSRSELPCRRRPHHRTAAWRCSAGQYLTYSACGTILYRHCCTRYQVREADTCSTSSAQLLNSAASDAASNVYTGSRQTYEKNVYILRTKTPMFYFPPHAPNAASS